MIRTALRPARSVAVLLFVALAGCQTYGGKYTDVTVESSLSPAEVYVIPYTAWAEEGGSEKVLSASNITDRRVSTSTPVTTRVKRVRQVFAIKSGSQWEYVEHTPKGDAETLQVPSRGASAK